MLSLDELKYFAPFKRLANVFLEELLAHVEIHTLSKGESLYKNSKEAGRQYFLLEGRVNLIDIQYSVCPVVSGGRDAAQVLNTRLKAPHSASAESPKVKAFSIDNKVFERIVNSSKSAANAEIERAVRDTGFQPALQYVEEVDNWMSCLLESPIFSRIPLTKVQELFTGFDSLVRKRGEVVFHEGERGDFFYVLASGRVSVTNCIGTINITLGPGEYFGEEALLGNTLRNATVTMTQKGCLKRLSASNFAKFLKAPVVRYVELNALGSLGRPYKLLDVKTPLEFKADHLPGCINVPLARLRSHLPELGRSNVYVVPDDGGGRADIAVYLLCQAGFEAVVLRNEFQMAHS